MFNFYLDHAIQSSPLLTNAAASGDLLAFADDILLTGNSVEEVSALLAEMDFWQTSHGLLINRQKTVFFTNRRDCKELTTIMGYQRVDSFKYLGIKCTLNYHDIRVDTKSAILKNLQIMSRRLKKSKNLKVKDAIIQAYFRSLVVFHCTPLFITKLINEEFILKLERQLFRKITGISTFINNDLLKGWTKGEQVLDTIK